MDRLDVGGREYISARRASEMNGYAPDYLGQLCREGKISGTRVGRGWFIDAASLQKHIEGHSRGKKGERVTRAESVKVEGQRGSGLYEKVARLGWGAVDAAPKYSSDFAPLLPLLVRAGESVQVTQPVEQVTRATVPARSTGVTVPVRRERGNGKMSQISAAVTAPLYGDHQKLLAAAPYFSAFTKIASVGALVSVLMLAVITREHRMAFIPQSTPVVGMAAATILGTPDFILATSSPREVVGGNVPVGDCIQPGTVTPALEKEPPDSLWLGGPQGVIITETVVMMQFH